MSSTSTAANMTHLYVPAGPDLDAASYAAKIRFFSSSAARCRSRIASSTKSRGFPLNKRPFSETDEHLEKLSESKDWLFEWVPRSMFYFEVRRSGMHIMMNVKSNDSPHP